jgi:small-conductance mechanosensitive channel
VAADFHIGEMEMERKLLPRLHRALSLTAFYGNLSMYGERPGLAFLWLFVAVFLVFPFLYWATRYSADFLHDLVHSLETSTFLEVPKDAAGHAVADPILARFVAGFERITVPVLAGVFALAIKRKFERK